MADIRTGRPKGAHHEGGVSYADPDAADDAPPADDGGGWGIAAHVQAAMDLSLGKLGDTITDAITEQTRRLREEARAMPALVKISSAFTYSTAAGATVTQQGGTGIGVLIGGPEVGRQWHVRQIVVGGTTITAAPSGTVWLFAAAAPPNDLSLTSVVDFSTGMPNIATYSEDEIYVAPNENLWLIITGGTNATVYVASVTIQESAFMPRLSVSEV